MRRYPQRGAKARPSIDGGPFGVVKTLKALAGLLGFGGRVEIRGRGLWYSTSFDVPLRRVAFANLSEALILAPVYDGADVAMPARTVGKNEDLARVATEIVCERVLRVARAA